MIQEEIKSCHGCGHANSCQRIYRQLGQAKGPSVLSKVMAILLLPMVIFIVSLAVFDEILTGRIGIKSAETAISLLFVVFVTFIYILIIKMLSQQDPKIVKGDEKLVPKEG